MDSNGFAASVYLARTYFGPFGAGDGSHAYLGLKYINMIHFGLFGASGEKLAKPTLRHL